MSSDASWTCWYVYGVRPVTAVNKVETAEHHLVILIMVFDDMDGTTHVAHAEVVVAHRRETTEGYCATDRWRWDRIMDNRHRRTHPPDRRDRAMRRDGDPRSPPRPERWRDRATPRRSGA